MFQYPREMGVATSVFPTNTEHMTWTLRQLCCLCASVCTPFTTVRVTMIPRRHGKIQNRKLHFSLDTFTHATFIFEKKNRPASVLLGRLQIAHLFSFASTQDSASVASQRGRQLGMLRPHPQGNLVPQLRRYWHVEPAKRLARDGIT